MEDVDKYLEDENWFGTNAAVDGEGEHTTVETENIGATIENSSGLYHPTEEE